MGGSSSGVRQSGCERDRFPEPEGPWEELCSMVDCEQSCEEAMQAHGSMMSDGSMMSESSASSMSEGSRSGGGMGERRTGERQLLAMMEGGNATLANCSCACSVCGECGGNRSMPVMQQTVYTSLRPGYQERCWDADRDCDCAIRSGVCEGCWSINCSGCLLVNASDPRSGWAMRGDQKGSWDCCRSVSYGHGLCAEGIWNRL